ncbi:MAG: hypothetical protein ACRDWV_09280 [Acidimicrobiales bacterium]
MTQSKLMKFVAPNRAVLIQHVVATLALVVAALAVVSTLVGFNALGIPCGPPLFGAHLQHTVTNAGPNLSGSQTQLMVCSVRAPHRLITAIIVFILAITAGIGGWFLPLGLPWWLGGDGGPNKGSRR